MTVQGGRALSCQHRKLAIRMRGQGIQAQCLNPQCKKAVGGQIPWRAIPPWMHEAEKLEPWDRHAVSRPTSRTRKYRSYLKTGAWKARRLACAKRAEYECAICGGPAPLDEGEADHKTYVRLGEERPSDLQWLCIMCHRQKTRRFG